MRYAKPPKLPGHLTPLQKRRLRKVWKDLHNPSSPVAVLLGLPERNARYRRFAVKRRR